MLHGLAAVDTLERDSKSRQPEQAGGPYTPGMARCKEGWVLMILASRQNLEKAVATWQNHGGSFSARIAVSATVLCELWGSNEQGEKKGR